MVTGDTVQQGASQIRLRPGGVLAAGYRLQSADVMWRRGAATVSRRNLAAWRGYGQVRAAVAGRACLQMWCGGFLRDAPQWRTRPVADVLRVAEL